MSQTALDEITDAPMIVAVIRDGTGAHERSIWAVHRADGTRRNVLSGPVAQGAPAPGAPRVGAHAMGPDGTFAYATGDAETPALALQRPDGRTTLHPTPAPVLGVAWTAAGPTVRIDHVAPPTDGPAAPRVRTYRTLPVRDWDAWRREATPAVLRLDGSGWTRLWEGPAGSRLVAHAAHPDGAPLLLQVRTRGEDGLDHDRLLVGEDEVWTPLPVPPRCTLEGLVAGAWGAAWTAHARPAQGFGGPRLVRMPWGGRPTAMGSGDVPWQTLHGFVGTDGDVLVGVLRDGVRVLERHGGGPPVVLARGITQACGTRTGWVGVQSGIGRPPRLADGPTPPDDRLRRHPVDRRHARSPDGTRVGSWLVHSGDGRPRPTLLWVHGGPLSSWADTWHPRWSPGVFVDAGYTVLMPDPRGSLGRGAAFRDAVGAGRWGEGPIDDLQAALAEAGAHPAVDPARVAVMGASFGGWAAAWLASEGERFRCAVVHAAPTHLGALHGDTDVPGFLERHLGTVPGGVPDVWSPVRRAATWRTPTLITHGEQDMRVPVGQAIALFQALHRAGVDARLRVYREAHHWLIRPADVRDWHRATLDFLGAHLGPVQA